MKKIGYVCAVITALFTSLAYAEPSKNYVSITVNEDTSVTIYEPKFGRPGGKQLPLSAATEDPTICRRYGFAHYIPNSVLLYIVKSEMVRLTPDGTFGRYDSPTEYYGIWSIMCINRDPKTTYPVSTGIKRRELNDDGSTWIADLTMKFSGTLYPISAATPEAIVCKRFGFSTYVENSIKYESFRGEAVELDESGYFKAFVPSSKYKYIAELICR